MSALVDAQIAAKASEPIDVVLINLGANDVGALPAEATWKTNAAYILDAFHTAFPGAAVYVAKPWRRGYATECDTLATWIDDVLVTRAAWASVGHDERTWLEGGDNGVTMTTDGTHYSTAGLTEIVSQWMTVLGY